jgi:hypothetical protein
MTHMAVATHSISAVPPDPVPSPSSGKGLKSGAIGAVSNVVIGVSSTAPAYSLAATLGAIVAVKGIGLSAPAVLIVSFLPMLCIALGYRRRPLLPLGRRRRTRSRLRPRHRHA